MGADLNETIFLKIKIKTLFGNLLLISQCAFPTMETSEQYVKSV